MADSANFDLLGLDFDASGLSPQTNEVNQQIVPEQDQNMSSKDTDIFDLMFGHTAHTSHEYSQEKTQEDDLLLFDPFAPVQSPETLQNNVTFGTDQQESHDCDIGIHHSIVQPELDNFGVGEPVSETGSHVFGIDQSGFEFESHDFRVTNHTSDAETNRERSHELTESEWSIFDDKKGTSDTTSGFTIVDPIDQAVVSLDSSQVQPVVFLDSSQVQPLNPFIEQTRTDSMERPRGNLNRSMEKSFEDLLHGLDSDSEPDLDEMITNHSTITEAVTDDSFNAMAAKNKEKLAIEKMREQQLLDDSSNNEKHDLDFLMMTNQKDDNIETDNLDTFEFLEQEKQTDSESEDGNFEMEDTGQKLPETDIGIDNEIMDDADDEDNPVVMITQDNNEENVVDGLTKEESFDFSVLQDGNQLDVDIGKQKTCLRKKGSLARRKKPTRTSVRSILSSSEDSHYTDTTEPGGNSRPTSINGFDGDVFGLDLAPPANNDPEPSSHSHQNSGDLFQNLPNSPPAKKPSLSIGSPLPDLFKKPPSPSSTGHVKDQDLDIVDAKKDVSSVGVKLPMPVLKPSTRKSSDSTESTSLFDKPALRSVNNYSTESNESENDISDIFDKPVLKSVPKTNADKPSHNLDNMFDTPKLKKVTRSRTDSQKNENFESDSSKMFEKPALRNISRDKVESKDAESDKTFVKPALKTVKPDEYKKQQEGNMPDKQHVFEKPSLRSTPKQQSISDMELPSSPDEKKGSFDIPVLRKTPKPQRKEYSESDTVKHTGGTFEKPSLKTTSSISRTDSQDSESKHTFDKPSLRNVQKPPRSDSEGSDKSRQSSDASKQPSWLKDMKLRRSKSPERVDKVEKESSKPSWANTAAEKRSKARDLIETKENQNKNATISKTPWSEQGQLRKTPNGLPLQEDNRKRRTSSSSSERSERSESTGEVRKFQEKSRSQERDQYVPSWMKVKDTKHKSPSTPNLSFSPPDVSEETPQWKIQLAQRRKSKKDSDTPSLPQKQSEEVSGTPSWKLELQRRRKSTPNTPVATESKSTSKEPEWKKKAEEKRQRLNQSGLLDRKPVLKEKPKLTNNADN